jgi:hypothetical protein
MSEPESKPPKTALAEHSVEHSKLFEGINVVANSQAIEAVVPDPLALNDEEDLTKEYPESLSRIQSARDEAEIARLGEGTRYEKRVNITRFTVLGCLFLLIAMWILSVVALTVMLGFHFLGFTLPDAVIIAYITSTTASVLGLFIIAARWLFSSRD